MICYAMIPSKYLIGAETTSRTQSKKNGLDAAIFEDRKYKIPYTIYDIFLLSLY